jgi:glycogen synthase
MRVLCLATEFPPAHGYGLGRYAFEHSAALAASGVEVAVACSNSDGTRDTYEVARMQVNNAPYALPFHAYAETAEVLQAAVGLLGRGLELQRHDGGYDLLQIHDWLAASAAKALQETCPLPLVVTMHDTQRGRQPSGLSAEEQYVADMEAWVCEQAAAVTVNSEFLRRELVGAYGVPAERITVIGGGVNPASFTTDTDPALFRSIFCGPDEMLVAFVGRLTPVKGPHLLLEAIPYLIPVSPQARFVFTGDGPMREGLERRAAELGIADRVRFTGHIRGQVLATFYRAAEVVVVPSLYEPLGLVALEAMVCGTPVVVSDTGGLAEIVQHDQTGLKVPPNDPRALAAAIAQLLFNPQRARALGAAGQARVETAYRWADVAQRTREVYERVLAARVA